MIDVVIVGFGFSAVPLVRELVASRTAFTIISAEESSIWDGLSTHDRMGFDLVSSYLTSFYSFDLVEDFEKDYYPTARQFFAMHQKWRAVYADRIVRDEVTRVDNFGTHSVVHTRSGPPIEARHVVFATGFRRGIFNDLTTLDFDAPNQTFVFDTMGDSANLLISHLIPHNVKIIIRTNGFHARDKVVPFQGATYTLDQLEFHNYRYVSHAHYASIIYGAPVGSGNPILLGDQFPASVRDESHNPSKSQPPSGAVAIKYWPIDEYCRSFGPGLADAISSGYALNDIAMWLHTGRAIVVPKDTPIDFEKKTITYAGITRAFDRYVSGDAETPRLPPILIDGHTPYVYRHREAFMGVIPSTLSNVYLIGYTRPYTGGLANIIEMQGLLVHKLVTQPAFHDRVHRNLGERIAGYDAHYFGDRPPRRYDHLVYYGFYTEDVARLIGIDHKLGDCRSLKDLLFYYAFPNNAFKYRLEGEYAVPGVEGLIEKVNRQFDHFVISFAYLLSSGLVDAGERTEWLLQARRNLFNDMRHKEVYRLFVDHYIDVYRQTKGIAVVERDDPEWDALVAKATEARDRAVPAIRKATLYQMDHDLAQEVQLIASWMAAGHDLEAIDAMTQDPRRAALWSSLMHPTEYALPFLD